MAISKDLLDILLCPEDRSPLAPADEELVARLNREIAAGRLRNRAGGKMETPLDGGLIRRDRLLLYPVVDGIPIMLIDEAIPLEQLGLP